MTWITIFAPCLVIVLAICFVFDQRRLTRPEGNLKRGVMIWAETLSWETRQALETLPPGITQRNNGFVRKEGSEVLISAQQSFWQAFLSRRDRLNYIGYVDLRSPEIRLELRVAWSMLVSVVVSFGFILILFSIPLQKGSLLSVECVFSPIFLVIFIGAYWFNYYRERKLLLDILNQVTGKI
jgi:hypothetical protein